MARAPIKPAPTRPMPGGMMGGNGPTPANALRPMPARMAAPQGMMGGNGPAPADALRPMQGSAPAPSPAMMQKFGPPQGAPGMPAGTRMGGMMMKKGGAVKSASSRGDGIAQRGKTKGMLK